MLKYLTQYSNRGWIQDPFLKWDWFLKFALSFFVGQWIITLKEDLLIMVTVWFAGMAALQVLMVVQLLLKIHGTVVNSFSIMNHATPNLVWSDH